MGKTRKELLEKYYEQEMNRVFMSSNNYLMTSPKKGREDDFFDAWACANMLKEMMDEEAGKEMGRDGNQSSGAGGGKCGEGD